MDLRGRGGRSQWVKGFVGEVQDLVVDLVGDRKPEEVF